MAEITRYYYCEDGETAVGPFAREKFQELLSKEVVPWEVWVTREDDTEWRTAADFEELRDLSTLVATGKLEPQREEELRDEFASFDEDERRAEDLQTLQRAASRIDLSRFREAEAEREEVPTGEAPSALWFLPYLRMKYAFIAGGFALCLLVVYLLAHNMAMRSVAKNNTDPQAATQSRPGTAPAVGGGTMGSAATAVSDEEAILAEDSEGTPPQVVVPENAPSPAASTSSNLANSRVAARESPALPADFYLLARSYTVKVESEIVDFEEGTRVRVMERQPDMWTVEAEGVRFPVSPTDLRRENSEGVSTLGTTSLPDTADAGNGMAVDAQRPARSTGGGVPPPALPGISD